MKNNEVSRQMSIDDYPPRSREESIKDFQEEVNTTKNNFDKLMEHIHNSNTSVEVIDQSLKMLRAMNNGLSSILILGLGIDKEEE